MSYTNFKAAVYFTAGSLNRVQDWERFAADFAWFLQYIQVGKVYLEPFRGNLLVEREKLQRFKTFFQEHGIETAGGITASTDHGPTPFFTLCYTNPTHRQRLQEAVELTAELFDEIILDDFYFTTCKCSSCIETKGDLSWSEFRLQILRQAAEELILAPAKRVNPGCKVVIKYPNWYEHFQSAGYDLEELPQRFDGVYTGTETRDPRYTQQDIPRYLSYCLPLFIDRIAPGKNGGGWFDLFDSYNNLNYFLEQAHLTLFSKVKEVTLFCFDHLVNTVYVPLTGFAFEQTDRILGDLGTPVGVPCYKPYHSSGEDFLPEYLGMAGVPVLLTPEFPVDAGTVLLTADAAGDPEIVKKLKRHLLDGKNAVVTSGLAQALAERGFDEIALWRQNGRKMAVTEFAVEMMMCGFRHVESIPESILLPIVEYGTNDSWPLAVGIAGSQNAPILLETPYGQGRLIMMAVPDNFSALVRLPARVLTAIRRALNGEMKVILESGGQIGLFIYDNETFILESFLPYHAEVRIRVGGSGVKLRDLATGKEIAGESDGDGTRFAVGLKPSVYRAFRIE